MHIDKINVGDPDMQALIFEAALQGYVLALNDMLEHMSNASQDAASSSRDFGRGYSLAMRDFHHMANKFMTRATTIQKSLD